MAKVYVVSYATEHEDSGVLGVFETQEEAKACAKKWKEHERSRLRGCYVDDPQEFEVGAFEDPDA